MIWNIQAEVYNIVGTIRICFRLFPFGDDVLDVHTMVVGMRIGFVRSFWVFSVVACLGRRFSENI